MAEGGLFNIAGKTPLESAEIANLWHVFNWLSLDKAIADDNYNNSKK